MNKLIFLGTGNAANLERQMTSLLFMVGNKGFLIDCGDGMGTVRQIVRTGINLFDINDVFITHRHADHIIGIPHFLFVKLRKDKNCLVNIYGPEEAVDIVKTISFLTHDYLRINQHQLKFHYLKPNETVKLFRSSNISGMPVETANMSMLKNSIESFAYSILVNSKKITFTGDMSPTKNFTEFAKKSDILIHECGGTTEIEEHIHKFSGHSTAKDAGIAATKAETYHLILTHFSMDNGRSGKKILQEAQKYFSGKISLATDLMEIAF